MHAEPFPSQLKQTSISYFKNLTKKERSEYNNVTLYWT